MCENNNKKVVRISHTVGQDRWARVLRVFKAFGFSASSRRAESAGLSSSVSESGGRREASGSVSPRPRSGLPTSSSLMDRGSSRDGRVPYWPGIFSLSGGSKFWECPQAMMEWGEWRDRRKKKKRKRKEERRRKKKGEE